MENPGHFSAEINSDAVQEALDVTGDAVGRHDEHGVDRMDVAAGYRSAGMTDQGRDRRLGESEIAAYAGEAVPENIGCDVGQFCILEQIGPLPGEGAEWRLLFPSGKDIVLGTLLLVAAALEIFQNRQADRTNG